LMRTSLGSEVLSLPASVAEAAFFRFSRKAISSFAEFVLSSRAA
jgi:hypothetical protein